VEGNDQHGGHGRVCEVDMALVGVSHGMAEGKLLCYMKTNQSFDVSLTAHLSITLVNDQLDAQFLYFTLRLLQSSTCFEQRGAHHQEVKFY
jgi:hypothetical protein